MTEGDVLLSKQQRRWLIDTARQAIAAALEERGWEALEPQDQALQRLAGCFVTLHSGAGELRGCIGNFSTDQPLWKVVPQMAVAAAFNDPRFPSLTREEWRQVQLDISVLSPRRVAQADEVEVGVHGIWLSGYGRSGVLLPQVAVEWQWDRTTFLQQTCRKAGLPLEAWQDPNVQIELFTAEVWAERDVA